MSDIFERLKSLEAQHAQESKLRIASNLLDSALSGFKGFEKALDGFADAHPNRVLAFVWGSLTDPSSCESLT